MMKKGLVCMLAAIMALGTCVTFAACNNEPEEPKENTVSVVWYDGRSKLKEEDVVKGTTATEWTPTKDGFDFRGWWADASFATRFDFAQKLQDDTNIFSKWRPSVPETDERIWYAIGSIANSSWNFLTEINDDGEWVKTGKKNQDGLYFVNEGENVFSIELVVRTGQKFQFVTNLIDPSTWEGDEGKGRMGCGNLVGFHYATGTNPEKGDDVNEEDLMYGEVLNEDGEVEFYGGFEYDMPTYCWNIWPARDGRYKFSFKSYPGYEMENEIQWELIEAL